jgi:hypothetical protein
MGKALFSLTAWRPNRLKAAGFAGIVFFSMMVALRWDARTGWTEFLRIAGNALALTELPALQGLSVARMRDNGGYDGQFYAQLALYPALSEPMLKKTIDNPAYRSRRIFLPWVAALLGGGDAWRTLQVFALLNVACWFALAALLRRWLPPDNWRNVAMWTALLFGVGVIDSIRYSLTDLPALLLLAVAVRASELGWRWRSVAALAIAALTRETSVLGAGVLVPLGRDVRSPRAWLRSGGLAVLVILPLAGWMYYVREIFGPADVTGGGNFAWPGMGWLRQVGGCSMRLAAGEWTLRNFFGLLGAMSLAWQAAWLCWRRKPEDFWWRIGAAHVVLFVMLGDAVWASYWAAMRAMLPLTAAYTLSLRGERRFWALLAVGHLTLPHALWRLVPW